jgi:8-oxo-dGTP pyrophosphatase MutT (NUDIX family)
MSLSRSSRNNPTIVDETEKIIRSEIFGDKRTSEKLPPKDAKKAFGLVVVKDGKILLVNPKGHDFWEIPKGHAEVIEELPDGKVRKEPGRDAAVREVKEETGITAKPTKILGWVVDKEWNHGQGKVVYAWLAEYERGLVDQTGKIGAPQASEIAQGKFFEPEEALDKVEDYLKPLIKKAIGHIGESIDSIIDKLLESKPGEAGKLSLSTATKLANEVLSKLKPVLKQYEIAGSIRRGKSDVSDIDIVVIPTSSSALRSAIQKVGDEVWGGEKQLNMMYKGTQFNFVVTTLQSWGAALMHATGSGKWNMILRFIAKKKGLKLNQYGLFDTSGKLIASKTEEAIYKAIGKGFKTPEERNY